MSAVAAGSLPANDDIATAVSIVGQALRDLGVNPVAYVPPVNDETLILDFIGQSYMSDIGAVLALEDIAAQALRSIGVNPVSQADMVVALTATHTPAQIAALALQQVTVNLGGAGAPEGTVFALADIATRALIFMNVYASDETPSTQDAAQALNWTTAFHDDVIARGYGAWSSSAIPAAVANLYAIGIAAQLAPAYEKPADPQGYAGAMAAIKLMGLGGAAAQTFALDHVGQVHQMLVGKNIANWDVTAVPDAVVEYYATLTAQEMCAAFGIAFNPAAYNGSLAGLRRFVLSGPNGQALAEAKVIQAHEALAARNYVAWQIQTVPTAAADSYVQMAAFLLEPMLGRQPDMPQLFTQAAWDAAVERVREIVLSGSYAEDIGAAELVQIHDGLIGTGSITWTIDTIPSSVADAYTTMLAANLAPIFGKQSDAKVAQVMADKVAAFSLLMASQGVAEQTLRGLHAEWSARGMARWTTFDIPREIEESYVNATACRLGPQYPPRYFPGGSYDAKWEAAAEMMLWRIVTVKPSGQRVVAEYF